MRKANTYPCQKPVAQTGKVNPANMKVSRANVQSRPSGILFAPANGKLYFAALKILSVPQNNLPLQGKKCSEVAFPSKTVTTKIPKVWQQKKTDRVRSGANPKPTLAGTACRST
jgi:hypothetical protein